MIETLWEHTAGLSPRYARGLLAEFNARSLITLSSDSRHATLHDLLRNFAAGMAVKRFGSEAAIHQKLLDAYAAHSPTGWASGPNDGYFFEHLPSHLDAAGHAEEVRTLLMEFAWIDNKLNATNIGSVIADFDRRTLDEDALFVADAMRLSAGSLADASQLAGQLLWPFVGERVTRRSTAPPERYQCSAAKHATPGCAKPHAAWDWTVQNV